MSIENNEPQSIGAIIFKAAFLVCGCVGALLVLFAVIGAFAAAVQTLFLSSGAIEMMESDNCLDS